MPIVYNIKNQKFYTERAIRQAIFQVSGKVYGKEPQRTNQTRSDENETTYAQILDNFYKPFGVSVTYEIPPKVDPASYEPTTEMLASQIRANRNRLLSATDAIVSAPDYPISEESKKEILEYRQALRDITEQEGFPENVVFPKMPEIEK